MDTINVRGQDYKLPGSLDEYRLEMYVHLINWKWEHITREPGLNDGIKYDTFLPAELAGDFPMLYPEIKDAFRQHLQKFPFRVHKYFNHMASSQAANANLFLPVLLHPNAADVLRAIKPDFAQLATGELDHGFRIEFWDEPFGNLRDKSKAAGTDVDMAIAYFNFQHELCLWLIEHKLTEKEFTTCGAARSPRIKPCHDCSKSFAEILANKDLCFYHHMSKYNYWKITDANQSFFANHNQFDHCPFHGGLNQLWRNQLLGLSIEQDIRQPYRHVTFSVVKHPGNLDLDATLSKYHLLVNNNPKFTVFTSKDVLDSAAALNDPNLNRWVAWYRNLYAV